MPKSPELAVLPSSIANTKIHWLRLLQIALDALLIGLALFASYLIRFDCHPEHNYLHQFMLLVLPVTIAKLGVNWLFGVYRRLWRYTGLAEVIELGSSLLLVTTGLLVLRFLEVTNIQGHQISLGIIIID